MNAKLAVAISLGASSLALFGMANVANAATVTTTDTGANQPVVKPSTENPVEKAKGEANKAIEDAKTQKETVTKEVEDAESEVTDAYSKATDANNEVTEAQKDLENKQKEANTAEEQQKEADKELDKQKTAAENADKEVKDTQAAFDKETENQTAAENKLKATQDEKDTKTTELGTAEKEVQTKTTEQTQAGEKVKTEQGKLDDANTQLEKAKKDKETAENKAKELENDAKQKEQKQKEAEQAVTDNENQQEEKNKEIKRLREHKSADEDPNVKKLKGEAEQAHEAYTKAQGELNQKTNDIANDNNTIQSETEKLNNAKTALEQNEDGKKFKNAQDKVEEAQKEAKEAEDAYNKANTEKLDANVQKGFDGFLDYIISKYKNDDSVKGKAIYADALRAKDILTGKDVVIPDTVTKTADGGEITHKGRTIKAPMWYKDLVKLKRVGGADSLKNLKDAATYYKPLNEERTSIGLNALNVNLSMIAESIVNSYYSGAVIEHSANHADYNSASSMNTNPYLDSSENLAWGSFDKYDSSTRLKREHTRNDYNNVGNAMDGWYDAEKAIYDNAIEKGTWSKGGVTYTLTNNDKEFLKNHRYDFTHQTYSSDAVNSDFESAVGHYLNFVDNKINSCGFADSNNSVALKQSGENVVVWHGSKQESQLSVKEFTESLNEYIANLTGTRDSANKLEPSNAENLKSLSAKITEKNKKLFDAKYELRKVQYDLNMTPDGENTPLQTREKDDLQAQKAKIENAKNDLDKEIKKTEKFVQEYEANPYGNWPSDAKKDYEHDVKSYLPWAKRQSSAYAGEISSISSELEELNAKIASSSAKGSVVTSLVKNIKDANTKLTTAKAKLAEDTKAKEETVEKATELKSAWDTAQQKYQEAEQAATQASQEDQKTREQKIQKLQNDLNGLIAKAVTLKSQAETAKQTAKAARTAAKAKQEKVDDELTKAVNEAQVRFDTATQAVKEAKADKAKVDQELKAANEKVTNLKQTIQTLEAQIATENQKVTEANGKVQAARAALDGAKDTQNTVTGQLKALQTKAQNAVKAVKTANDAVEAAKENVVKKIKLAQTAVANAQTKVSEAQKIVAEAKIKIETIQKNLKTAEEKFKAVVTDPTTQQSFMQSTFLAAYPSFNTFIETLTGKVSTLQTTATNLTKSATALNDQLQKVAPESVVTPPVVPPAPKPPVVVPSHDGESGHGNTGNTGNTTNTGNPGNTGNNNVPFIPQTPHVSVPAVDVEQQSNEFASTTAENHATQSVSKSEAGKSTKEERANAKNTKRANHTASANAAATSNSGVAQSKNAKDSKNAESKESAKEDSAKQETQDSNSNSSDQNSTPNSTPNNESKNAQANGNAAKAQNSSNNTLTIGAVVAVVIAGIVAIGGGVTFARHRRM